MNWPDEVETLLKLLPTRQPFVVRYGITSILVLLSFAVRHGVGDLAGPYGFILFVPALVIASVAFGWRAGLFAVAFSALIDGLWLDWSGPNFHATALATFVIIAAGLVFLGDALRRALEGLNRARNENQMLLDEMSHRVKNKFAMIISVISLQSRAAPLEARPALEAVAAACTPWRQFTPICRVRDIAVSLKWRPIYRTWSTAYGRAPDIFERLPYRRMPIVSRFRQERRLRWALSSTNW